MKTAEGTGVAHDATVVAVNDIPALEAALSAARVQYEEDAPRRRVAALRAKRDRLAANLAGVEAALTRAEGV